MPTIAPERPTTRPDVTEPRLPPLRQVPSTRPTTSPGIPHRPGPMREHPLTPAPGIEPGEEIQPKA